MIKRVQPKQGGILESELIIPEDLALNEVASMKFILINDALDLSYDLTINQEL